MLGSLNTIVLERGRRRIKKKKKALKMVSNEYQNIIPYVTKTSLTLCILLNQATLQEGSTKHNY